MQFYLWVVLLVGSFIANHTQRTSSRSLASQVLGEQACIQPQNASRFLAIAVLFATSLACSSKPVLAPTPTSDYTATQAAEVETVCASVATQVATLATESVASATPIATSRISTTSTIELAKEYFSAIVEGDREGARSLIGADPWCTPIDVGEKFEGHLAILGSTQVRNVSIEAVNINGYIAYPPGAEAARVSFEYRSTDSTEWRSASIGIVTASYVDSGWRFICDLWPQ